MQPAMKPLVSVIIPAYNCEKYISEAVQSVLNQTYDNYEIIVVDDGSTDNTKKVLEPFFSCIKYVFKENGGPASARNSGIENSSGKLIAFLDGDDCWEKDKLMDQVAVFEDKEIFLVYSARSYIDEKGRRIESDYKVDTYSGEVFQQLYESNFIATSSVMVRKECFEREKFCEDMDLVSVEDYDMWLKIAALHPVQYIDKPLLQYRVHAHNISNNMERSCLREMRVLERTKERFRDRFPFLEKKWKKRISTLYFRLAKDLFTINELDSSRKYFFKSIALYPFHAKAFIYLASIFFCKKWILYRHKKNSFSHNGRNIF